MKICTCGHGVVIASMLKIYTGICNVCGKRYSSDEWASLKRDAKSYTNVNGVMTKITEEREISVSEPTPEERLASARAIFREIWPTEPQHDAARRLLLVLEGGANDQA